MWTPPLLTYRTSEPVIGPPQTPPSAGPASCIVSPRPQPVYPATRSPRALSRPRVTRRRGASTAARPLRLPLAAAPPPPARPSLAHVHRPRRGLRPRSWQACWRHGRLGWAAARAIVARWKLPRTCEQMPSRAAPPGPTSVLGRLRKSFLSNRPCTSLAFQPRHLGSWPPIPTTDRMVSPVPGRERMQRTD
jgi:hypothetical protein